MKTSKILLGVLFGLLAVAAVFCIITLVFSSVHHITFVEQLKEWFSVSQEVAEETEEVVAQIGMLR